MKRAILSMMILMTFVVAARAGDPLPPQAGNLGPATLEVCGSWCIGQFDCSGGGPGFGCGSCLHGQCTYLDPQNTPTTVTE
jgi:hypothetical protein